MNDRAFLDVIKRMAISAEYREWDNSSHIERIRQYCFVIASDLGIPANEAQTIAYAAQLHDVGKVILPDAIINKAGKFQESDWEIVESHTTAGARLLEGSAHPILQTARDIALTHHERWDGSGYPEGLKGDQIPLTGRICALADMFDALTTERSYKEEFSVDEAFDMMLDTSGKLLDPSLVDIFKTKFNEFKRVKERVGTD